MNHGKQRHRPHGAPAAPPEPFSPHPRWRHSACKSRSDDYRRFAAECLKLAQSADDETRRSLFLQMAQAWLALAQREEAGADRKGDPHDKTS